MSETVVIGIGNPIRTDDGVGVHAARQLRKLLPPEVQVIEGSVYCADMLPFLENCRRLVVIDGIDAGDEPGAVFRFSPEQVRDRKTGVSMSIHDFGVYDMLTAAELLGHRPAEVVIFAVQVGSVETGEGLTDAVEKAVPEVCRLVIEELGF